MRDAHLRAEGQRAVGGRHAVRVEPGTRSNDTALVVVRGHAARAGTRRHTRAAVGAMDGARRAMRGATQGTPRGMMLAPCARPVAHSAALGVAGAGDALTLGLALAGPALAPLTQLALAHMVAC